MRCLRPPASAAAHPSPAALLLGAILVVGSLPGAGAAIRVFRWVDRAGIVHYGDRAPDPKQQAQARNLKVMPVRAEPGAVARLRLESSGGRYLAWADNLLSGPIEVMLESDGASNMAGAPPLPVRATVAANASALISVLSTTDPTRSGGSELRLRTVPGDPDARPRDVEYQLPLRQPTPRIEQGYGGSFSHSDPQNLYAVDFAADIGTPVLCAREGVVMQVESDFDKAGLNLEKFGGRANYVRILHDDGTMGLYAHLQEAGVLVRVGQRVLAGQQIGLSGNTGFTTGPHLHFAVQVNRGMHLESLAFRMRGPRGTLSFSNQRDAGGNL